MPLMRALIAATATLLVAAATVSAATPSITASPEIAGTAAVGSRLAVTQLGLDQASVDDATYTWERSDGRGFAEIADAHDGTYEATTADVAHRLRVHVVVETADGVDEAWSEPTEAVAYAVGHDGQALRVGPAAGAPARLNRWVALAGEELRLTGAVDAALASADARLVLEPTVPSYAGAEAPVAIAATGMLAAVIQPTVNAVAWLELAPAGEATQRIRLGVVGVRPRIGLVLGARSDGRDASGRRLIRDLRILAGSTVAPGIAGLRLTWEGMLPGDRTGTAVCRSTERVISVANGRLRGGCRTRGTWSTARWRLVLDAGTANPLAAPFLPTASAWVVPRLAPTGPTEVPNLLRSSATLRPWS